jgi:NADPH-dependent 2,4-dienoyl-CoA reductase/sulfur reductase-like enzyme
VKITSPSGSSIDLNADFLAIGYHLIPNTELPQLLHCKLERGFISVDRMQRSSVAGVYCAGEVTGIGGAEKAQIEGQIAALAASGKTEAATRLANQRERHLRFVRSLDSAFALRDELRTLPTSETVVCRCEDITHGALAGCRSWREAKLHTRCGMGPCQGRICSPATQFLYGWEQPQPRPPLFPVEAGTLAGMQPELLSTE